MNYHIVESFLQIRRQIFEILNHRVDVLSILSNKLIGL
jgi:hypothetical protein